MIDEGVLRRAAMMWVFVVRLQASRLYESVGEFNAVVHDRLEEGEGRVPWRETWGAGADMYFFLSAASQLCKCVRLLSDDGLPEAPDERMIRLLRNFHDHWEDPTGWSAVALKEAVPDAVQGRLAFNKHDVWIEGVSMYGIVDWAQSVESALRAKAREAGETLPGPVDEPVLPDRPA